MTYKRLFYLKYQKGLTTYDLVRQFPSDIDRVSEVALLDVPEEILRKIVREDETFHRLMWLKRRYSNLFRSKAA